VSPTDPLGERPSASCISESSGEFSCSGLLPGDYECQLRSDSAEMSDSVEVSISAESSPRVLLRSYPSATLRVMVDADSKLQLGAISVFAKRKGSAPLLARQAGGAFVFDPLPLGSYDVSLDPAVPGAALRVEVARPGEVLEVRLAGISSRTLTGRVIDERGQGVSDAWVRVAGDSPNSQARPAAPVLTDPQGEFTVEGLLPGRYRVDANSARGEGLLSDALAGESVTVTLRTFGSLSGTVSTANGAPVPRFIVAYSQSNGEASGRVSGFNGSWSLPWLAPGTYELEATAPEGTASGTVEVSPGGRAAMALSLRANEPGENSSATARR